jgi:hypothetical protein
VDAPFIQTASPDALFPADETVRYLQEEGRKPEPFRAFQVVADDNLLALNGVEQVGGHHGNEIGRYRALLEGDRLVQNDLRVLKLLNATFVVSPQPVQAPGLEAVGRGTRSHLYRLPEAFPRAYLVDRYEVLPDSLALRRLFEPDFDPRTTVILEERPAPELEPQPGASGSIRWLERGVNGQRLEVSATAPALLVVTDSYYPAWRARLAETEAPILRANLAFRAIPVPAGQHELEIFFRSDLFRRSVLLSLSSGIAVVAILIAGWATGRRHSPARTGKEA